MNFKNCILTSCLIGASLTPAYAHTPQDGIDSLAVSPDYANDHSLSIIVQNSLLQSRDRGASWKQLIAGLDNRYVLSDVQYSPGFANDGTMYAASDGDGVFRSRDRGQTWRRINEGLDNTNVGLVAAFALPGEADVVFAAGSEHGMYARLGTDKRWQRVVSGDVQITAVTSIVVDGETHLLAGASDGTFLHSSDDPLLWHRVSALENAGGITSLAVADWQGPLLFVGAASGGMFKSDDLGKSFNRLDPAWPQRTKDCLGVALAEPVDDWNIRSIRIANQAVGKPIILANTWNKAALVSNDLGDSWEWRGHKLVCDEQADKTPYLVPHYRNLELTSGEDKDWFLAAFDGLYRSHDAGENWHQLETMPVYLLRGMGVSPAREGNFRLGITTYGGGAYFTGDLGESWTIANRGLLTTRLADLEYSPSYWDDDLAFVGEKEHLPHMGADGESWIERDLVYRGARRWLAVALRYNANLPASVSTDVFLSDFERTQIWPMQLAFSPNFANDETVFIGHRRHGVWFSTDGGEDWERDWEGELSFVTALAVSPAFGSDRTVLAAMRGAGIYKTDNGGKTWKLANNGFRFLDDVRSPASPNYVIDRPLYAAMKDVLLVMSPDFGNDKTAFASSAEGLFRSDDAAESWVPVSVPDFLAQTPVTALGISPDFGNDGTIVASFKGHGLAISRDKGLNFEVASNNLLDENWELKLIEFSPRYRNDGIIMAGTDEELLVSRDRGTIWTRVRRPVRYEDWRGEDRGPMEFSGEWERELDPKFSGPSQAVAEAPGARASLRFLGSSVAWLGERGPGGGIAHIYIDGQLRGSVDLFAADQSGTGILFAVEDLSNGPHVIDIEVGEQKNPQSNGRRITVDAIDTIR